MPTLLTRPALATALLLALVACNNDRRGTDPTTDAVEDTADDDADDATGGDTETDAADSEDDAVEDAAPDAPPDALLDAEPDVPPDAPADADADDPPIFMEVGSDTSDVEEDAPPGPGGLEYAFVGQNNTRDNVQIAPLFGDGPVRVVYEGDEDLSHVRFSPNGLELAFLAVSDDGRSRIGLYSLEAGTLDWREPDLRVFGLGYLDDGTMVLNGSSDDDPTLRLYFYETGERVVLYETFPGAGRQHREAISAPFGFGVIYLEFDPPDVYELWFDGMADAAPMQLTEGVPAADDLAAWPGEDEGAVLFTNPDRQLCWTYTAPFDPVAPPFTSYTCHDGVEEFHPRPTPDGCCVITSRYPPEVSTRPAPRDLYLFDIRTGEPVRQLTNTPLASERWPDIR